MLFFKSIDLFSGSCSISKYIMIGLVSFSLITYLILFCLKEERIIVTKWLSISIPVYICVFTIGLYLVFLLPNYLEMKNYLEISVVAFHLTAVIIFLFLIHFKADNVEGTFTNPPLFTHIFIPLYLSTGWHSCYAFYNLIFSSNGLNAINNLLQLIGILLMLTAFILIGLLADKKLLMHSYIPVIFMLFSSICLYVFLFNKFKPIATEEEISHKKV
jgi:hypothetical protein